MNTPDLIVEAAALCERLWMASVDVTEMGERRIDRILKRAEARLLRREFAELDRALLPFDPSNDAEDRYNRGY